MLKEVKHTYKTTTAQKHYYNNTKNVNFYRRYSIMSIQNATNDQLVGYRSLKRIAQCHPLFPFVVEEFSHFVLEFSLFCH